MRKITLIILLAMASNSSIGQNTKQQSQILQKCIDLPELQQYYPVDKNKNFEQLNLLVVEYPTVFSNMVQIEKFGKDFNYLSTAELNDSQPSGYFVFNKLDINGNNANVEFEYSYKVNEEYKTVYCKLLLKNNNENWNIIESNIK